VLRAVLLFLLSAAAASSQTEFGVQRSDGTVNPSALPPQVLFDLRSASPPAQQALMPLYQQEWSLLQELNTVKWQALGDTLGGLSAIGGPMIAIGSNGSRVANESAARAGTPGYKFKAENAALSAQTQVPGTPASQDVTPVAGDRSQSEMYVSVNHAMQLLVQIQSTEEAISGVQKSYGIPPTARTPWSILFPVSKRLSPSEVSQLLAQGVTQSSAATQTNVASPNKNLKTAKDFSAERASLQTAANDAQVALSNCTKRAWSCAKSCAAAGSTSCGCESCDTQIAESSRIAQRIVDLYQQEHLRQIQK
jgi:hypothetical protein